MCVSVCVTTLVDSRGNGASYLGFGNFQQRPISLSQKGQNKTLKDCLEFVLI